MGDVKKMLSATLRLYKRGIKLNLLFPIGFVALNKKWGEKKEFLEKKYKPDSYPRKRSMNKSLIDHNDRPENLMFNRVRKKKPHLSENRGTCFLFFRISKYFEPFKYQSNSFLKINIST